MDKRQNIDVLGTGGMSQNWDVIRQCFRCGKNGKAGYYYDCWRSYCRFRSGTRFNNHED